MDEAYGIIFNGVPGQYAIWSDLCGLAMTREIAERIGQFAIRSGAADYRVFPLTHDAPEIWATDQDLRTAFDVLRQDDGIPHQPAGKTRLGK
jgi:hypothetical protein